ncbi:MAG TPA: hypothetical protein VF172_08280 [Nitrososphaera sp.]|jgi:hypothetical protein
MPKDIARRYHSIIVTPAIRDKHEKVKLAIFKQMWKYLSNDYAIIYVAEPDPTKVVQQISKVAAVLAPAGENEIENYIASGALTVISRNEFFSPSNTNQLDIHKLTSSFHSLVLEVQNQSIRKGVVAIGDPSILCEAADGHRHIKLTQYESAIGREFAKPLETICWYSNPEIVSKMSFSDLVILINAHHSTIHSHWLYREWRPHDITAQVKEGMDRMLGKGTANLIFKTLKLVYKIDPEKAIISRPEIFEEKIRKIMGDSVAELLFEVLADAMRKEMSFDRIAQLHY